MLNDVFLFFLCHTCSAVEGIATMLTMVISSCALQVETKCSTRSVQIKLGSNLLVLASHCFLEAQQAKSLVSAREVTDDTPGSSQPARINEFKCGPFRKGPTATPPFRLKAKETHVLQNNRFIKYIIKITFKLFLQTQFTAGQFFN